MPNQTGDWLPDMQSQYLSRADKRLAELSDALESFIVKPNDCASELQLRQHIHNLIGSGGSFGFLGITEAALALANSVKESRRQRRSLDDHTVNALRADMEKVREAFGKAIAEQKLQGAGAGLGDPRTVGT